MRSILYILGFLTIWNQCTPVPPINPIEKSSYHTQIGIAHLKHGRPARAEKELRAALNLNRRNEIASEYLAVVLLRTGRPLKAEEMAFQTLSLNPSSGRSHLVLAQARFGRGEYRSALESVRQALALLTEREEKKVAEKLIEKIQQAYKEKGDTVNDPMEIARNDFEKEHWKAAEAKLKAAVIKDPRNVPAMEYLALLHLRTGRDQKARDLAGKILAIHKRSAIGNFVLGICLKRKGDMINAKPLLVKARTLADQRGRALFEKWLNMPIEPAPEEEAALADTAAAPKEKMKVAVFPFTGTTKRSAEAGAGNPVSEMLITALINTGAFNVIERSQLDKVMAEQKLSQSGAVNPENAVKVGKLLGCTAIIIGSVTYLPQLIEADARLIEVETAQALAAVSGRARAADKLREMAEGMARDFVKKTTQ